MEGFQKSDVESTSQSVILKSAAVDTSLGVILKCSLLVMKNHKEAFKVTVKCPQEPKLNQVEGIHPDETI